MDEFSRHKKIDAHTHIGNFGSPFNVNFDMNRLLSQMETFNIEKTILCPGHVLSRVYSSATTIR